VTAEGLHLLPPASQLWLFMAAVALLNATPGVDLLLTITRTLQGGSRAGVAAALGISAGCVVHALAAAFGLAALLALHPQAFAVIQWMGAAYLLWLGLGQLRRAWRSGAEGGAPGTGVLSKTWTADFRTGLLTNVLNPKVALFFLAFLPQFVPFGTPHKTASFLLLGGVFVLQGTLFLLVTVAVVARLRRWQTSVLARRVLSGLSGLLFIALAWRLLSGRVDST
jgi:threonine/homoserine/homoserine lactone efflux protein